jgi:malonyl-CoA O-methyltransferase
MSGSSVAAIQFGRVLIGGFQGGGTHMAAESEEYVIDAAVFRRNRQRAAVAYEQSCALADEVGRRMFERLEVVRLSEGPILDLGCATGRWTARLRERYTGRDVFCLDPAEALVSLARPAAARSRWWLPGRRWSGAAVCGALERIPFRPGTFSMVWSNLALQWLSRPAIAWREIGSSLRGGGLLMFSSLGPDTLGEVRAAWRAAGLPSPVMPFADMHNVGDALVRAGFAAPVMDMEHITLEYPDPQSLVADLRNQGAADARVDRRRGLASPRRWRAALGALRVDGGVRATFEIVYGHAWWPDHGPMKTRDGLDIVKIHGFGSRR